VRFNRSELSEDQTNMAEVALALTSETDVRKLAGIILGKCRLLAHGDRSALFLLDEGTRELVEFAIVRGDGEVELRERGIVRVAIGSGVAGHCAASGNPLNIDDAYEDARWSGQEYDQQSGYRTKQLLCCPIKAAHSQKVLGVMQIVNTMHGGSFAPKDVEVVQAMAASAGVALENAQNLERAQDSTRPPRTTPTATTATSTLLHHLHHHDHHLHHLLAAATAGQGEAARRAARRDGRAAAHLRRGGRARRVQQDVRGRHPVEGLHGQALLRVVR
jgi:GAF domain-containing protein